MLKLTDRILEKLPFDIITDTEISALFSGTPASRYNQIKRALASEELIQIRRGLYILGKPYRRKGVNSYELAQAIYGPSYISFESALSYHGLIPEAVYTTSSATTKRGCEFDTPMGRFSYAHVPMGSFRVGVERIEHERIIFLMGTPLKALTDLVWVKRHDWTTLEPLRESLRIETESLKFQRTEMEDLKVLYRSMRITRFLEGISKELNL